MGNSLSWALLQSDPCHGLSTTTIGPRAYICVPWLVFWPNHVLPARFDSPGHGCSVSYALLRCVALLDPRSQPSTTTYGTRPCVSAPWFIFWPNHVLPAGFGSPGHGASCPGLFSALLRFWTHALGLLPQRMDTGHASLHPGLFAGPTTCCPRDSAAQDMGHCVLGICLLRCASGPAALPCNTYIQTLGLHLCVLGRFLAQPRAARRIQQPRTRSIHVLCFFS